MVQPDKRILVVEDDDDVLMLAVMVLEQEGYAVESARNGAEAMEALTRGRPDLILLDLKMPVMSGRQFAAELLGGPYGNIPIVVLSAAADAARRARELGVAGYLVKPFDLDALLATVARYLPQS